MFRMTSYKLAHKFSKRDFIRVKGNGPDEIWVLVLDNRSETVKVIVIYQSDVAVCLGSLDTADVLQE